MIIVRGDVEIILKEITEERDPFHPPGEHNNQITNAMNVRSEWGLAMDIANPICHTTKEETKKTARKKMNHQWNLRGKGSTFALHLDNNMETIKHKNGMAYYLLHESRISARARARFRFNRVMTNTV